jgi:enoyl-CoA hydratase/carnithine racemase
MSKIQTERKGRAFMVIINRPEVHNAVDAETAGLLWQAVESFRHDESLDVLILTGAGGLAFCAGADLNDVDRLLARPGAREYGPLGISRITELPKTTIAAINGYCLAGGDYLHLSPDKPAQRPAERL